METLGLVAEIASIFGHLGGKIIIKEVIKIFTEKPSHPDANNNSMKIFRFEDNNTSNVFWFQWNMAQFGQSYIYKSLSSLKHAVVSLLKNINSLNTNLPQQHIDYCKRNIKYWNLLPEDFDRNVQLPMQGFRIKTRVTIKINRQRTNEERRQQFIFLCFNALKQTWKDQKKRIKRELLFPKEKQVRLQREQNWRNNQKERDEKKKIYLTTKKFPSLKQMSRWEEFIFHMNGRMLEQVARRKRIKEKWSNKILKFNENLRRSGKILKLYERVIYEESGYDPEKKCGVNYDEGTITTHVWFDIQPIITKETQIEGYIIKTNKIGYLPHQKGGTEFVDDYVGLMHRVHDFALDKFVEKFQSGPLKFKRDFDKLFKITEFDIINGYAN